MASNKTRRVLVMIESSRESGRQLISGIADYSLRQGSWEILWEPVGIQRLSALISERPPDGVLARNISEAEVFREQGIPVILFAHTGSFAEGQVYECADDQGISATVVEHFMGRGFTNFAFFGQTNAMWALNRSKYFKEALCEHGFDAHIFMADCYSLKEMANESNIKKVCSWLESLPRPVAILAANDDAGRWIIQLCQRVGIRVPEDCAIVGVDNDPVVCGLSNPPLSSVELCQRDAGYEAAEVLDQMMRGERPQTSQIIGRVYGLEVRRSSDIFSVDDVAVAKALKFIHAHVAQTINVNDVAQISGLHRRALERRFRNEVSQTVVQYARRIRADYIAKLLRESRNSLDELTQTCGFSEASNLSRFFYSVRGETPSAYRKRLLHK